MDPNEALNRIRHAIENYRKAAESDSDDPSAPMLDEADSIVEHFEALDGWMTRGGFLPTHWALKRESVPAELPRMVMFRNLSPSEAEAFRVWARENYTPGKPIDGVWHPVIQAECVKMNVERATGGIL